MRKNQCPYCRKIVDIPEVAYLNCEFYGTHTYILLCTHCKKVIAVTLERVINLVGIYKSKKKKDEIDW
jgi:hypothetical protein